MRGFLLLQSGRVRRLAIPIRHVPVKPGYTFTFFSGPYSQVPFQSSFSRSCPQSGSSLTLTEMSRHRRPEKWAKRLSTRTCLFFLFLTYPFLLAFDRKSPELILFLLVALFAHSFSQKKFGASGCFLALAAGFKMYPMAFSRFLSFIRSTRRPCSALSWLRR